MSQNTGSADVIAIALAVAIQDKGVVITSSPGQISKANNDSVIASVHEATPIQC